MCYNAVGATGAAGLDPGRKGFVSTFPGEEVMHLNARGRLGVCIGAIAFALLPGSAPDAVAQDVMPLPTRWIDPQGPRPLHEPVPPSPPAGTFTVRPVGNFGARPLGMGDGRVAILVNSTLYDSVSAAIAVYAGDVAAAGYFPLVATFSGNAEFLRTTLIDLYGEPLSLVGAVLVGEHPHVVYEMNQDWGSGPEYEDFPCDIYFMDLDGTWTDALDEPPVAPANGKLDTWTGDRNLEIWVSRMRTSNLTNTGSEADLLEQYFARNHVLRWDILNSLHTGLVYNDDDWEGMSTTDAGNLSHLFTSGNVTTVSDPESTTASDYINNRLNAAYQLMSVRSHGSTSSHGFYRNNRASFDRVYGSNYLSADPLTAMYSLFICSGADYLANQYLAGTIVFNPQGSALLAWGSTKTGGMWSESSFYQRLADGVCVGEAFRHWFNQVKDLYFAPRWWYGMVLIGDATCRMSAVQPPPPPGDLDGDYLVDADDVSLFLACASGPAIEHDGSPACQNADFDGDADVDANDFGVLQRLLGNAILP